MSIQTWRVVLEIAGVGNAPLLVRASSAKKARETVLSAWGGKVLSVTRV